MAHGTAYMKGRGICGRGRTKRTGADSGEHRRGLIAAQPSVLERRCQKFPGGLRTPAPAFHPLLCFPASPHLTAFSSSPSPSFSPRSECSAVALLTLIPHSSLLTCPTDSVCVCALRCEEARFPYSNIKRATHAHSDKLIDE